MTLVVFPPLLISFLEKYGLEQYTEDIQKPRTVLFALIIISFLGIILFGTLFVTAKEKYEFNEFGSRKKNAKRHLSSHLREQVEAMQLAENEKILPTADIKKSIHKGSTNPQKDMEKMIGMTPVKERIRELSARMEFDDSVKKKAKGAEKELHHMIFYGPPGTGKTTVARIITGLFYEYGYISQNKVVEIDGNFLKAANPADTEKKVRMILSKAYGGVLFVDEAYALTQSHDAAGKQAIATLIKEMEDKRDQFIAIFAGYPDEMSEMLNTNPGFRSRIKDYIEFEDYNNSELRDIAIIMFGQKGFTMDPESLNEFYNRISYERGTSSWGNARTIRNIVEETIDNHAINYQKNNWDSKKRYLILPEDIKPYVGAHI